MTFSHRTLKEEDAGAVCGFARSADELFFAFPKATFPLTPDVLLAAARQRLEPTVALCDGKVVGYANFIKVKERGFCAIGNLMVHPDHRRQGVAAYLVNVMMRKAFETYCARFVRAACFSHNQAAYQLYHGLGFKPGEMEQRATADGTAVLLVNLYLHRRKVSCDDTP
ncbi:MAG: GNAT family N-acetyltransferase [Desulfobacteraceae bacterium]|jgi:ribosomal protein S18 acetylase RimI-like enzyme